MAQSAAGGFSGRTALVTGGGRNIGRAIALAFADRGIDVGIVVRANREEAEAVAREVRERGARAAIALGDVGQAGDCERMVGEIAAALGPVDYLVNNAARRRRQAFLDIAPEDWDAVIGTNLSSIFYLSRLVLPGMAERGFGRIVNIGGPDGVRGLRLRAHNVACKAGLIGLTKAIALEFGIHGITANIVVPGNIATSRDEVDYPDFQALVDRLDDQRENSQIAIPRQGTCEEVADAVMHFASDKSAYLTSQTLYVAGGLWGLP
ncbi:SDR family NAD(P)-dependent oxidoreductase [Novosphingobium bradum]|uniref:SDR family NAD(P)-dependent oxidoreductase n=1 Tax=Novosphingobium bradum TaxID=1737444 RepID=A0ABV7IM05_9SPHN